MDIFKILAICLITAFLAIVFKGLKNEYALAVALGGGAVVTLLILQSIVEPLRALREAMSQSGMQIEYFKVALKALGIGYITGFIADACRDSGQTSLANKAELAGKCAIFALSLPLVLTVLQAALELIS